MRGLRICVQARGVARLPTRVRRSRKSSIALDFRHTPALQGDLRLRTTRTSEDESEWIYRVNA